ncbi:DUF3617 family protein [Sphingomonas sp. HF-S4]|uniref:DUF3617 family protein n=1 Tax=Sphingomonas agrestis TaxID=3080540 RepID=A0ABU3YD17_9SPHN|nr:DUF3617 family protein [Sphingomonas sp. HF-S4]MDV3459167.1 DUF3617 family protein [Sphingomonas sp. HF-S4]
MRATIVLAATAFALSACQSAAEKHAAETGEIDATNAKADEVAGLIKAASAKTAVKPGLWKATLAIEAVDVGPGADNARQLEIAKRLERDSTECRTAEQLKPFDIDKLEKAAGECTFIRYVAKGGKVDARIQCSKPNAPVTTIEITGTSTATGFDVVTQNKSGVAGQAGYSLVRMRSTGTRVGECPAQAKG